MSRITSDLSVSSSLRACTPGAAGDQVKGLQAEYERVTSGKEGKGDAKSEVDEWRVKVDRLIREKGELQVGVK